MVWVSEEKASKRRFFGSEVHEARREQSPRLARAIAHDYATALAAQPTMPQVQVLDARKLAIPSLRSLHSGQKSRIILIRLFYPNRRFGISSRFSVYTISSIGAGYHHGIAVYTFLRFDDIQCSALMISSHFVSDDIHFLRK